MTGTFRVKLLASLAAASVLAPATAILAQNPPPPDHPAVTVKGQTYTPRSILARNMGTDADQTSQFPPHKVIGNIYYVGTRTLSSYLVTTPQGHILINSTYERNVPVIQKSMADLGFRFSDVKVLLGTHAHGDHQEGDAAVKQATGAQVVVMEQDIPALRNIKPGGKEHPIDRTLRDRDTVQLGGVTLTAHLTPGHTRGCTTWTMPVQDGGRTYNVVFACSLRAPGTISPEVAAEFNRTYPKFRALPCDVPLGDHPAQYNMIAKHAKLASRRRQSVRRSRELHGRGRHPGGDVQGHACRAAGRREIAGRAPALRSLAMCRNIRTLFNFEPPATEEEIRASALQFVQEAERLHQPFARQRGGVPSRGGGGLRRRAPLARRPRNRQSRARPRRRSDESARTGKARFA